MIHSFNWVFALDKRLKQDRWCPCVASNKCQSLKHLFLCKEFFLFFFIFIFLFFIFFSIDPPQALLPVLGPLDRYMTPTLDVALLSSSRAGADLGRK